MLLAVTMLLTEVVWQQFARHASVWGAVSIPFEENGGVVA